MEQFLPDIAGSFQRGQAFGTQQRLQREGEQRRNDLSRLAGMAYTAPVDQQQALVGQAVGIDADAGMSLGESLEQSKGARTKQLAQRARLFVGMAEAGNPEAAQSMYPQLAQEARNLGLGDVPLEYSPQMLPALKQFATLGDASAGQDLKNLRVGDDGYYYGVQNGQFVNTGIKAQQQNQVFDTGAGIYGINKSTLQAAPVQIGGAPPQQPQAPQAGTYQTPQGVVRLGDDLTPEQREAAMADIAAGGGASAVQLPDRGVSQPTGGGQQLRSAPKPASVPAGYRQLPDGSMEAIPGGPAQIAIDARADAAEARQAAEDAKAGQKRQAEESRQIEASAAATQLVSAIDDLTKHPGFASLGTEWGDLQINTPIVRNDAKDAAAKLRNISGQVALSTMARLKALSSTGATGFGSLTAPELKLLQNSIDTLESENISNSQLVSSLKTIRDFMDKTASWVPSQSTPPAPATGGWGIQKVN